MGIGSIGVRTQNLTITQASLEIRTTAAVAPLVREFSVIQATGTAQSLGLGRPQALGVTPGTISTFQRELTEPVCVTTMNLTWATSPTVPLVFHRRWNSSATIGVGVLWTFPRGLQIPVSSSLVLWNITAAVACDVNVVLDE